MYANKMNISKIFGVSPPTVYKRLEGIRNEMGEGKRYNPYAILENLVSIEVYADYEKYRKRLADKNFRKTVPPFNMAAAREYLEEEGYLHMTCQKPSAPF